MSKTPWLDLALQADDPKPASNDAPETPAILPIGTIGTNGTGPEPEAPEPSAIDAGSYQDAIDERRAIAEIDGEQPASHAAVIAFDGAIASWMNRHPPLFRDDDLCTHCRKDLGEVGADSIAVLAGDGHRWIHHQCREAFLQSERKRAQAALKRARIEPPEGWAP